ncbi:unnamed protein product [Rotaria magnacalcarata]
MLFYVESFLAVSYFKDNCWEFKNEQEINVDDPCSDEFYEYFRQTAKRNSQIYEEVFSTLPSNQVKTFVGVEKYAQRPKLKETDPLTKHEKCKQIKGFIVECPLEFLADGVLMPRWNTSEGMAPILLWTLNRKFQLALIIY